MQSFLKEFSSFKKAFSQKRINCFLFNYDDLSNLDFSSQIIDQITSLAGHETVFCGIISRNPTQILKQNFSPDLILAGNNGFEIYGPGFSWTFPKLGLVRHQIEQLYKTLLMEIGPTWTRDNTWNNDIELNISIPESDTHLKNNLILLVQRNLNNTLLKAEKSRESIYIIPGEPWSRRELVQKVLGLLPHGLGLGPVLYYFGSDIIDEPAFQEANLHGHSVLIKETIGRKTAAQYYLRDFQELSKALILLNSQNFPGSSNNTR